MLGDGDKRNRFLVESLDQLGKVGERAGEPVDFVNDDDIDAAGVDVSQQPLQRRAVEVTTGIGRIIIARGQRFPAIVHLRLDVGLASFALGIERVKLQLQPMLGRLAGVDGAAPQFVGLGAHGRALSLRSLRRPKKRGPFQRVPVMMRAICERLS